MPRHNRPRLLFGKAHRMGWRQLAGARSFVDICRIDPVGLDPDLPEQVKPAGRSGSEHEEGRCRHWVIPANAARKSA